MVPAGMAHTLPPAIAQRAVPAAPSPPPLSESEPSQLANQSADPPFGTVLSSTYKSLKGEDRD